MLSFRGCLEVSLLQRCSHSGVRFGKDEVSFLQRCSHSGVRFGKDEVSLLQRCSHSGVTLYNVRTAFGERKYFLLERCPVCIVST